jgi:multiple sugar transport system permease protein
MPAFFRRFGKPLTHLLLMVGSAVMIYPLIFSLAASLTSPREYAQATVFPIPSFYSENYRTLFQPMLLPRLTGWVGVTLVRIGWYVVLGTMVAVLCGYVFARLQFRGREVAFLILLGSLLVPEIVFQVPLYVMMARWPLAGGNDILGQGGSGYVGRLPSLLLPGIVNAYFVFLMRQAFYAIPVEYEEAARIDGASTLKVLWHVYLPMLKPVIAVLVINTTIAYWNQYIWPRMVTEANQKMWPVALAVQKMMDGSFPVPSVDPLVQPTRDIINIPFALAAGTVAALPPLFCFFLLQRYFVEGLQGIGIKG